MTPRLWDTRPVAWDIRPAAWDTRPVAWDTRPGKRRLFRISKDSTGVLERRSAPPLWGGTVAQKRTPIEEAVYHGPSERDGPSGETSDHFPR